MSKPYIIGISGPKEHGKSTLANKIANCFDGIVVYEIPEPMIEIAKIITLDDDFQKSKSYDLIPGEFLTGTQILQKIGSESFRHVFGDDIWTHRMDKLFNGHPKMKDAEVIIIPNIRMPVEKKMINLHIWIEAPGVETQQYVNHETESHLQEMKDGADIHVTRKDTRYYDPRFEDLLSEIHMNANHFKAQNAALTVSSSE